MKHTPSHPIVGGVLPSKKQVLFRLYQNKYSFTLVELLIVIGILAILTAAIVIVLNPAELLKQARDSKRLQDLTSIDNSLQVSQAIYPDISLGTASTVYVSIADTTSTCANLGLPSLPSGWSYNCVTSANLVKSDGTGWIPVNFQDTNLVGAIQISALPIDPVNTTSTGLYYTYAMGGSYEFNTLLESNKYRATTDDDGGDSYSIYEKGSDLDLLPYNDDGLVAYWDFEDGSGSSVSDQSGNGKTGTWNGDGSHWAEGKVGDWAGEFNGSNDYVNISSTTTLSVDFTYTAWVQGERDGDYEGFSLFVDASSYGWQAGSGTSGGSRARFDTDTVSNHIVYASGSVNIEDGSWHFVTVTFDRSENQVVAYADTLAGTPATLTGTLPSIFTNNTVGHILWATSYFEGNIDEVRIYNRLLSVSEIAAIYNATR